jgi:hypothetical protein
MRLTTIVPQFVEYMPDDISEGVLYISRRFETAIHRCACGCGEETVTPLWAPNGSTDHWTLTENERGECTLHGSVGNYQIPCKSHYLITDNQIIWL